MITRRALQTRAPGSARSSRRCNVPRLQAAGTAGSLSTSADESKAQIMKLSGPKYGLDLDADAKSKVEGIIKGLEGQSALDQDWSKPLTGTTWETVYNNSGGNSSGKLGPFYAYVTQEFPADAPGTYQNNAQLFGLITLSLKGEYSINKSKADKIDLEFKTFSVSLGPLTVVEKPFEPGKMIGFWRMIYGDDNFRAFYTNKGSIFVLKKKQ